MSYLRRKKAFTLIEVMVVVAIIAVMAGAVSVGFRSFLGSVGVRNAAGLLDDVIYRLELEIVRSEFEKSSLFFKEAYLLVDSYNPDARLTLEWEEITNGNDSPCHQGDIKLKNAEEGLLFTIGADEDTLKAPVMLHANAGRCINPLEHKEREVIYELRMNGDFSNRIRVFPLNQSLDEKEDIIIEANDYQLDILAPYSQKKRYQNGSLLNDDAVAGITIKSKETGEEHLFELPKN